MLVPAASDILRMLADYLRADATISAALPGGMWPKSAPGVSPWFTTPPAQNFGTLRTGPYGRYLTCWLEVHTPANRADLRSIREAAERAEQLLDYARWDLPTNSIRLPIQSYARTDYTLIADQGWTTQKYTVTITIDTQ